MSRLRTRAAMVAMRPITSFTVSLESLSRWFSGNLRDKPASAAPKQQTKTRQATASVLTRHPLDACCHGLVRPRAELPPAYLGKSSEDEAELGAGPYWTSVAPMRPPVNTLVSWGRGGMPSPMVASALTAGFDFSWPE